jgi:chromosome segregation ATPase
MPAQIEAMVNILQAAKLLKVTTKTIYNYLDKGLITAQKWNGSWRIPKRTLIEFYQKKYGILLESDIRENRASTLEIRREEFARLNKAVGILESIQIEKDALKSEVAILHTRVAELEASAASGWTEARKSKEELDDKSELNKKLQEASRNNQMECEILSRELTAIKTEKLRQEQKIEDVIRDSESLKNDLKLTQKDLEDAHTDLAKLKARYRRDAFL